MLVPSPATVSGESKKCGCEWSTIEKVFASKLTKLRTKEAKWGHHCVESGVHRVPASIFRCQLNLFKLSDLFVYGETTKVANDEIDLPFACDRLVSAYFDPAEGLTYIIKLCNYPNAKKLAKQKTEGETR